MRWLVTGGAGYVGSHVVRALYDSGRAVIVLDDLSTGHAHRLSAGVPLERASVLDEAHVSAVLSRERIDGVIHLAGKKSVTESLINPGYYRDQNVGGVRALLAAMRATGVQRLVFSSSAAVYAPITSPAGEACATVPRNPYGWSKLAGEQLIRRAQQRDGLRWLTLRYFNVAGAGALNLGDTTTSNLVPTVLCALDHGRRPQIFGADYPTRDGSCIRDYIHVEDVAEAHLSAVTHLEHYLARTNAVYNVGRGIGVSVREVLAAVRDTTGLACEADIAPRRPGDAAMLIADVAAIEHALGWRARRDLTEMIHSAWASWRTSTACAVGGS